MNSLATIRAIRDGEHEGFGASADPIDASPVGYDVVVHLVTGASGHLGANLVRALLQRGVPVRVLLYDDARSLDGLEVERVRGDVRDRDAMERACRGIEVVHHLAACVSLVQGWSHLWSVNVEGTATVARAALRCRVRRFVHCSSIQVFDLSAAPHINESSRRAESTRHYDRSKQEAEHAVGRAIQDGLDAVIVNPTGLVGPNDFQPSPMGRFVRLLFRGMVPIVPSGSFDWVDVRDVSDGLLRAAEHGRTGANYILGGERQTLVALGRVAAGIANVRAPFLSIPRHVAMLGVPISSMLAAMTGKEPIVSAQSLAILGSKARIDCRRAREELGFTCRPFSQSLSDLHAFFQAHEAHLGERPRSSGARIKPSRTE